jgi:hypothetical protein
MFGIHRPSLTTLATTAVGSAFMIIVAFPLSAAADDSPWDSPPPPPQPKAQVVADSPWDLTAEDTLSDIANVV